MRRAKAKVTKRIPNNTGMLRRRRRRIYVIMAFLGAPRWNRFYRGAERELEEGNY
jgi:hypothetical protein